MIGNPQEAERQELWRKKFPFGVACILSCLQAFFTFVIIGCEVGSVLIDILYATIYVGFWAGIFFMITCISQAVSACCCRSRGCASYTLVTNCISMFFALCVIGFDAYFLITPTSCFFPTSTCTNAGSSRGLFYTASNFNNIKMSLIKAQLAAGAVMFVLCLAYVIMYVVTIVLMNNGGASVNPSPPGQPPPLGGIPTGFNNLMKAPLAKWNLGSNELVCPTCKIPMNVSIQKQVLPA